MFGSGLRVVVVSVVTALLCGGLLRGAEAQVGGAADRPESTTIVDSAPAGIVASVARVRTSVDRTVAPLLSVVKVLVATLVSGLVAMAAAVVWQLAREDRRTASPLRRSPLAALRAPPAVLRAV